MLNNIQERKSRAMPQIHLYLLYIISSSVKFKLINIWCDDISLKIQCSLKILKFITNVHDMSMYFNDFKSNILIGRQAPVCYYILLALSFVLE